jgi:hypothetical protein
MVMKWIAACEEVRPVTCAFHFMHETFYILETGVQCPDLRESSVGI